MINHQTKLNPENKNLNLKSNIRTKGFNKNLLTRKP